MITLNYLQFFVISACVNIVCFVIYIISYGELILINFPEDGKLYDFIIVGAGTAGSLIAHRLATETNYTFIVVEAGGPGIPIYDMPIFGPMLQMSPYNWGYETVPQKHACQAMNSNKCKLPQGKIIGGTSKLNNMVHVRGNISHYVDWFHGKHTADYILEQFELIEKKFLHLSELRYESELSETILDAARELGYDTLYPDAKIGFNKPKVSQNNGKRWSLSDNLDRKYILSNTLVEKILFNGSTATGVRVSYFNKKYELFASKGVILSAGAFNTPKILQLSGIGPKKVIDSANIPLKKELPVGKNLQDHITTGLDLILIDRTLMVNANALINPFNIVNYFINGAGVLTFPGLETLGFVSTKNESFPNLQFMVIPLGISSDKGSLLKSNFNIRDDIWDNYFAKDIDKHAMTILPVLLHSKSKGEVYIKDNNALSPPLIDPKYLSNEDDVKILVEGLKLVKEIVESNAMKSLGAYMNPVVFPTCKSYDIFSDGYWRCYLKYISITSFHPVGTCSMGTIESKISVVDTSFRVIGVDNLFVSDSSVLPTLPSGNINAPTAMMASIFFETNISLKSSVNLKTCSCPTTRNKFIDFLYNVCYVI